MVGDAMPYRSVFKPGLLAGQRLWVTGGGSGIGRCTAHELAALGARVLISGRDAAKLARVAAEIAEDGGACEWTASSTTPAASSRRRWPRSADAASRRCSAPI
jgi:NAD(P)-dependent dehydrogenase (short-subunit alcohol dehydrogenase family)